MYRILHTLWPWRWVRTLRELRRGVRVHPSAVLIGSASRVMLGHGTKIGPRSRLDAGHAGRIVFGEKIWMSDDVEIQTATEVRIGRATTIQRRCTINGTTRIGADCIFAPNVFVSSGTHPFRAIAHLPIREQERRLEGIDVNQSGLDRPVWIQDDCWLGANTVVCPGVTIGKGSVVGANSVVTRDVPPYTVVAGSPARIIGRRLVWDPPMTVYANREEDLVYVLSGGPRRSEDGALIGVVVSLDEPLHVVLASPACRNGILVDYEAPVKIQISVGQVTYAVDAGCGLLELPGSALVTFGEAAICRLEVSPANSRDILYIRKVEAKI